MIKIAIFTPTLEGGVGNAVVKLANGLADYKDIEIDLLVVNVGNFAYLNLRPKIKLINFQKPRTLKTLLPLISYLKKNKPHIILSASFHANIICIIAKILSLFNGKVIITEHITLDEAFKNIKFYKRILIKFLVKFFYKFADAVVCVSEGSRRILRDITGLSPNKIEVIYNPVIDEEFYKKALEKVDSELFNGDHYVILAIGRLSPQKDFQTLIRAFNLIKPKIKAKLIIIGEGEERSNLERLILTLNLQNNVKLLGFIKNPYPYLKKADVFVLSSKYEGLPTVIIEALALGIPVISTDCKSGPREILENGKYGVLVPVGNEKKMAEAILNLLRNPSLRKKLSVLSKIRSQLFKVENAVNRYYNLFKNILKNDF